MQIRRIYSPDSKGLIILVSLVLFISFSPISCDSAITPINQTYFACGDNNYPPFEYIDEGGNPAGFNTDLLRAVAEVEGLNISITLGPWYKVRDELEQGKIDLVQGMFFSEERAEIINFSTPYLFISQAIFVKKGSDIRSINDLKNRKVAVQKKDINYDFLSDQGIESDIIAVENQTEALRLLSEDKADCAIVTSLANAYAIREYNWNTIEQVGPPLITNKYCFAVSSGNEVLLNKLNEGLTILKKTGVYDDLYQKWFGLQAVSQKNESDSGAIIAEGDISFPPYEFLDDEGRPSGFNVEIFQAVADAMGITYNLTLGPWFQVRKDIEAGNIDLIVDMAYSKEREKTVDFSLPYDYKSAVLFVRTGSPVHSLSDLKGRTVIVQKGDISHDFLLKQNVTDKIIEVGSKKDALFLLSSGEGDAAIALNHEGRYLMQKDNLTNIGQVGSPLFQVQACFAVKKGNVILQGKLNEGLAIIKQSGKYDEIYNNWFGPYKEKDFFAQFFQYLLIILLPIASLLALSMIWSWSLKRKVAVKTRELKNELDQRKLAEEALRENEEKFHTIADFTYDWEYWQGTDNSIIYTSPSCERITGFSPQEFYDNPEKMLDIIHPDDHEIILEHFHREKENPDHHIIEFRIIRKDGKVRWIEHLCHEIIKDDGRWLGRRVSNRDITDSKYTEEIRRLATILDYVPDATFAIDLQGKVIAWNKAIEILTGVLTSEIMGKGNYEYAFSLYGERRPILVDLVLSNNREIEKNYPNLVRNGEKIYTEVFIPCLSHEEGMYLWCIASPLYDAKDQIIGAIESIRNISDRKNDEEAVKNANVKLNLLSSITRHDILNQVTALTGYQDLLIELIDQEPSKSYIIKAQQAGSKIQELISFTRLYQDIGICCPIWQDIPKIIHKTFTILDPSDIEYLAEFDNLEIICDPLFEKVIFTLIENSIRHGGSVSLIRFSFEQPDDGSLILIYEDDGIGIENNEKDLIFERGYGKNTGLGLFLLREILSITGLSIRERGTAGKGVKFEIFIPKGKWRVT